ncbi:hypothetical protein BSKO_07564 [Bryopsis sp. KO-2023]|nr:hypothetical protein BSKO_07564 [Bryopsis sp. KO-2023]
MGMEKTAVAGLSEDAVRELCARPRQDFGAIMTTISPMVEDVRQNGDAAVKQYTKKFDAVDLDWVCQSIEDIDIPELPEDARAAFDIAYENIKLFHAAQKYEPLEVETMPGVVCRRVARPIEAVGVYVPGGTAVLPSSALMLSIPANLAGCSTIVLATPPRPDGSITPEVLYCAKKAGVTHILKAGGGQAVAAMAWGTESCPKVDKIFGPGNQYVTAAKMMLQNSEAMVSIDMPAGPSEVLVIADGGADPDHVACDLLSQAEHGPDSQVVLVTLPDADVSAIETAIEQNLSTLPRADVTRVALANSKILLAKDKAEAIFFSNKYAPEHLIINTSDAESYLDEITNAGSVFLGRWTPESVGDYASGTNHVLPTYGCARMYSGVSLDDFQRRMTVQTLSKDGLGNLGPAVAKMAEIEGLEAHRRAVTARLGME